MYPSSALRLATVAEEQGISLEGLVLRLVGEPVTTAKAAAIRTTGASVINAYAFTQQGAVATACPHAPESVHVLEHEIAVSTHTRTRPDGTPVQAYLWTSLAAEASSVWINVENDDYGNLSHDVAPCECRLGAMGCEPGSATSGG